MLLTDEASEAKLGKLNKRVAEIESRHAAVMEKNRASAEQWLKQLRDKVVGDQAKGTPAQAELDSSLAKDLLGYFTFDKLESGKLANTVDKDKPAKLSGGNTLVEGHADKAVQFTGDDPVDLSIGNFGRHEPFSVSLWLKTPDEKDRAVIFHRSRAWTDAASRGYELLIEDGRLKWSLIHFWPGNAISIAARDKVPVNQWQHVAVTYDGSSRASGLKIFVNGQAVATEVIKDKLTKEITGGGGDNIALAERFRDRGFKGGAIDEFRVYNRQLSPLDALALFDSSAAIAAMQDTSDSDAASGVLAEHYALVHDDAYRAYLEELKSARREAMSTADGISEIMVMRELEPPKTAYILARGEYNQRRDPVAPGVPEWLLPLPEGAPKNRLGVAKWLTDPKHPLTARVMVNRVWQSLFGRGLVKTAEDFGSQGSRPLYPEVLDYLSYHFITHGWDLKDLVKTIVMSETYQQRSVADATQMADDPDNEWLARGPRYRLPAEMIRDNALTVSGLLKEKLGGPPVNPYEMSEAFKPAKATDGDGVYRRSLYTNWRRTGPPPAMLAFDAPRRAVCIAKRERTDSPLQALILLNGIQYVEAARVLGEKLHKEAGGDVQKMIELGSMRVLSRPADARELEIYTRLYAEQLEYFKAKPQDAEELLKTGNAPRDTAIAAPEAAAATMLGQALLNHDFCVVKR